MTDATPPTRSRSPRRGARPRGLAGRLVRETTGAVYAEAVVMLPFFILVFGCILWVHTYESRRIQLAARVKTCAWAYANGGCGTVPDECAGLVMGARGTYGIDALPAAQSGDVEAFAQLPIVSQLVDIVIGSRASVERREALNAPPVLGGGLANIGSVQTVMCNDDARDPGRISHDAFCRLTNIC